MEEREDGKYFDPLLDDFGTRYVFPWSLRELGRSDSPIDLRTQLGEANYLFERGRRPAIAPAWPHSPRHQAHGQQAPAAVAAPLLDAEPAFDINRLAFGEVL